MVGAGLAGLQAVLALRAEGYAGPLTLVGAEPEPPYDRPPLSKALLRGEVTDTTLAADWAQLGVRLLLGRPAVGLRPGEVLLGDRTLPADGVVLATGAVPVVPFPARGVHLLRTVAHARALRARLAAGRRLVVVGAGWIGAEVATAAAAAGVQVTVVEAGDAPLATALPSSVGERTRPWYAEHGVVLHTGAAVAAADPDGVDLADGRRLVADAVLVAVGVRPDTGWLAGSGMPTDARGAVQVDAALRAGPPGVYAVGDCAAWHSRRFGCALNPGHWDDALRAPAVAAANLHAELAARSAGTGPGRVSPPRAYDPVPYFWSEQFGRMLQYAGHHPAADRLVWRGDPGRDATWTACWLRGGRLVALLAVGRPRDLTQGRRLVASGATVDVDRLTDPGVPLAPPAA